ncbi:MAG TPA: heme-binding protein [Steroidobacteraceae bacterium]|nr:heme-binding protein [Steroidobacteraceae bacterium]
MNQRASFCTLALAVPCTLALAALCASCSGGGVSAAGSSVPPANIECSGQCANAGTFLTIADVEQIISQGVAEAAARHVNATIAVVDRVGNVLAVYRMGSAASRTVIIGSEFDAAGNALLHSGLEGLRLPQGTGPLSALNIDGQAAIAKAITGAYLSSEGNAFSSRTASQIIQEHFNPGVAGQPSGPLFGVQFSQLACSDFMSRSSGAPGVGPQPSPLGLSADPGGFPLYKSGTVVGGVGAIADGVYGLDKTITDIAVGADEAIAFAASYNYAAPPDRRADQITANGVTLRFSDVAASDLLSDPPSAPAFASLAPLTGTLTTVPGYADGQIHAGVAFGQPDSGIRADGGASFPGQNAYVFVDGANTPRFPAAGGTEGAGALTQTEVLQLLRSALDVAGQTRAQIRIPVGLTASVTIAVVDTNGAILGMVRTADAPVFGADVSLQKARTAALLSSSAAAAFLAGLPDAQYLSTTAAGPVLTAVSLGGYVTAAQAFLADPNALADGTIAYSDRAIGNLSRPFFPDGIDAAPNGPFSKPPGQWSIFSTGLQLDLSINALLQNVLFAAGATATDVSAGCAGVQFTSGLSFTQTLTAADRTKLANGLQIFPGSVPIYRGGALVGAIGVSGDGVDQDDMIAFLGLQRAGVLLNGSIQEAPPPRRADTLTPHGTRLLYVQCPQSPFINSDQENVCSGY